MGMKFNNFNIKGIDVSEYNDDIAWSKVVDIDFCAIRVGFGRVTDRRFRINWSAAKGRAYRIPYWYMDYYSNHEPSSSAYGISDANWGKQQAELCWSLLKDDWEGIVFLDIEKASVGPALNTVQIRVLSIAKAFYARLDELSGVVNGLYASLGLLTYFTVEFRNRPLWVAWYTDTQTTESVLVAVRGKGWYGKCLIWQYASDGDMDDNGSGDGKTLGMPYPWLDLNGWVGTPVDWDTFIGGQQAMTDYYLDGMTLFSQRDPRWASDKMGTTNSTMGGWGCLVTAGSKVARWFGFDTDPGRLNKELTERNMYYNGNLFVFDSLEVLFKGITVDWENFIDCADVPAPLNKIDALLAARKPVIVKVDFDTDDDDIDQHWVVIVGKKNGSYIIQDTWDGVEVNFEERYGEPAQGIYRIVAYNGTPNPIEEGSGNMDELYKVKVIITNLYVRGGPGTSYPVVQKYASGIYSVFEEKNGYGRIGTASWISLNPAYVAKIVTEPGEVTDDEKLVRLWNAHPELH